MSLDNNDEIYMMTSNSVKRGCNCRKSNCLKLYCDCFQLKSYCAPNRCVCHECHNTIEFETVRNIAIMGVLSRNPFAFRSKIVALDEKATELKKLVHEKGCNCKKTGCLKKYCECYQGNSLCTALCRCKDCLNSDRNIPVLMIDESQLLSSLSQSESTTSLYKTTKGKNTNKMLNYSTQGLHRSPTQMNRSPEGFNENELNPPFKKSKNLSISISLEDKIFGSPWNLDSKDVFSPSSSSVTKILTSLSNYKGGLSPKSELSSQSPDMSQTNLTSDQSPLEHEKTELDDQSFRKVVTRNQSSIVMLDMSQPESSTSRNSSRTESDMTESLEKLLEEHVDRVMSLILNHLNQQQPQPQQQQQQEDQDQDNNGNYDINESNDPNYPTPPKRHRENTVGEISPNTDVSTSPNINESMIMNQSLHQRQYKYQNQLQNEKENRDLKLKEILKSYCYDLIHATMKII